MQVKQDTVNDAKLEEHVAPCRMRKCCKLSDGSTFTNVLAIQPFVLSLIVCCLCVLYASQAHSRRRRSSPFSCFYQDVFHDQLKPSWDFSTMMPPECASHLPNLGSIELCNRLEESYEVCS